METEDKQELYVINQKRKHKQQVIQKINEHKKQETKNQIIVKKDYLLGKGYHQVLTKKCTAFLNKSNKKRHLVIDYYTNNDYKIAKKLLKLNLIKILKVKGSTMTLVSTKLGKIICNRSNKGQLSQTIISIMLSLLGVIGFILSLFGINTVSMFLFICGIIGAYVCGFIIFGCMALFINSISLKTLNNMQALKALKKLLKPYQYKQEYKLFKSYALNS